MITAKDENHLAQAFVLEPFLEGVTPLFHDETVAVYSRNHVMKPSLNYYQQAFIVRFQQAFITVSRRRAGTVSAMYRWYPCVPLWKPFATISVCRRNGT